MDCCPPEPHVLKSLRVNINRRLTKTCDQDPHGLHSARKYEPTTGILFVKRIEIGRECSTYNYLTYTDGL